MDFLEDLKEKDYPTREAIVQDLIYNGYLILAGEEQPPEVLSEGYMDYIQVESKVVTYAAGRYVLYLDKDVDQTTNKENWFIAEVDDIPD